ncbi:MAG: ECF transporter S component [Lachnospiraceae bacterium]|nr:ECF transporter S component [Lachnospiraceae bacterium]
MGNVNSGAAGKAADVRSATAGKRIRRLTGTAMLAASAYVLMFLEFPIPLMPPFIKMDFSELPALIAAFAYGPLSGVLVCLVKNLIHLLNTQTGGVGELANFVLGAVFVFTAGMVYRKVHNKKGAVLGALLGAVIMGGISLVTNYYVVYPIYTNFMPMEAIIAAYQLIYSGVKDLWGCLLIFNLPFTIFKGLCSTLITFVIYKKLSPLLKGND